MCNVKRSVVVGAFDGLGRAHRLAAVATVLSTGVWSSTALGRPDGPPPCGYDLEYYVAPDCGIFEVDSFALGLNEAGVVVGYIEGCPDYAKTKAFVWWPDGTVTVIDVPDSHDERAVDVNNENQVLLRMHSPVERLGYAPAIWDAGNVTVFDYPAWANQADLAAINDSGLIVGEYGDVGMGPYPLAAIWADGQFTDLSASFPQPKQRPKGINNAGQIAGTMTGGPVPPSGNTSRAFLYQDGIVTELGIAPNSINSIVNGLSEAGHVVGYGHSATPTSHPWTGFMWLDGTWTILPPLSLPGQTESEGWAVNSHGVVVGSSDGPGVPTKYVGWFDGVPVELNTLTNVPPSSTVGLAQAISDSGIITGLSYHDGGARAYRMTPRSKPGADLTDDCRVDGADLAVLLQAWGAQARQVSTGADIDADGDVDGADLGLLLAQWTIDAADES